MNKKCVCQTAPGTPGLLNILRLGILLALQGDIFYWPYKEIYFTGPTRRYILLVLQGDIFYWPYKEIYFKDKFQVIRSPGWLVIRQNTADYQCLPNWRTHSNTFLYGYLTIYSLTACNSLNGNNFPDTDCLQSKLLKDTAPDNRFTLLLSVLSWILHFFQTVSKLF